MDHLTMLFRTEALLNKILAVSTADCLGGLAFKIVGLSKEKCAPKDRMAVVKRTRQVNAISLKTGTDLAHLFKLINQWKISFVI